MAAKLKGLRLDAEEAELRVRLQSLAVELEAKLGEKELLARTSESLADEVDARPHAHARAARRRCSPSRPQVTPQVKTAKEAVCFQVSIVRRRRHARIRRSARINLAALCRKHLAGRYKIEIVDVSKAIRIGH